jgi:hypothetical protein
MPEWTVFNMKDFQVMVFNTSSGKMPLPDREELAFMLSELSK